MSTDYRRGFTDALYHRPAKLHASTLYRAGFLDGLASLAHNLEIAA